MIVCCQHRRFRRQAERRDGNCGHDDRHVNGARHDKRQRLRSRRRRRRRKQREQRLARNAARRQSAFRCVPRVDRRVLTLANGAADGNGVGKRDERPGVAKRRDDGVFRHAGSAGDLVRRVNFGQVIGEHWDTSPQPDEAKALPRVSAQLAQVFNDFRLFLGRNVARRRPRLVPGCARSMTRVPSRRLGERADSVRRSGSRLDWAP